MAETSTWIPHARGDAPPPVVIVGAERSGTNLLRAILSSHSSIASPPPAGIIDALAGIQSRYFPGDRKPYLSELIDDVVALTGTHLNPWAIDLDAKAIRERMNGASFWEVFRVVNEIYAERFGRRAWCSKESGLFNHISEIAHHIPNAKFVYLARDGRDVALSLLRGHLHQFHVYFAAHYWAFCQRACMSAFADPAHDQKVHLLKYEDLIDRPEVEVRKLMNFIGLEFEQQQLRFHENPSVLDHSRRSRFWKNLARPIDGASRGLYKRNLGAANIEIFESIAWAEMEALGYALDGTRKRAFTRSDVRRYNAIALVRKTLWGLDPRAEGFRIRARVKATRRIVGRVPGP